MTGAEFLVECLCPMCVHSGRECCEVRDIHQDRKSRDSKLVARYRGFYKEFTISEVREGKCSGFYGAGSNA